MSFVNPYRFGGTPQYLYRPLGGVNTSYATDTFTAGTIEGVDFTTPGTAGTVEYLHVYVDSGDIGENARPTLHDTSGNEVAYGPESTFGSDPYEAVPFSSPVSLSASTTYVCGVHYQSAGTIAESSDGTNSYVDTGQTYGSPSDPVTWSTVAGPNNCFVTYKYPATVSGTDFITKGAAIARTSLIVPIVLPDDYAVDDIAFALIYWGYTTGGSTSNFVTPTGWTKLSEFDMGTANTKQVVIARRLDGTESPVIYMSVDSGTPHVALCNTYLFRGVTTGGTWYEELNTNSTYDAAPTGTACTTTGTNRLLVDFISVSDDLAVTSDGSWTQEASDTTIIGNDGAIVVQTRDAPTATTYGASSNTIGASQYWGVTTLALIMA